MLDRVPAAPVTFLVLAYNQERLIADALAGALAQDYPNLQIIVSDDCSTDRTFEVASELVARYTGPHSVECVRTPENLGTVRHILHVLPRVKGELVVLAAGDDVSLPHRTSTLVNAWRETGAWGLTSAYDFIDEEGRKTAHNVVFDMPNNHLREYFDHPVKLIHGAGSAYDRRAFDLLPAPITVPVMHEDALFSLALNAAGKAIHIVNEPLVLYREHSGSFSNAPDGELTPDGIRAYEQRQERSREYFLHLTQTAQRIPQLKRDALAKWLLFYEVGRRWTRSTFAERVNCLVNGPAAGRRWLIPRLFGMEAFVAMKSRLNRAKSLPRSG